jgi:hypothetical protein
MKDIFNVHGLDLKVKSFQKALSEFVGFCARLILIHSIFVLLGTTFIVNLLCRRIFVYSALQCVPYIFSLFCTKMNQIYCAKVGVWDFTEVKMPSCIIPYYLAGRSSIILSQ